MATPRDITFYIKMVYDAKRNIDAFKDDIRSVIVDVEKLNKISFDKTESAIQKTVDGLKAFVKEIGSVQGSRSCW